MIRFGYIGLGMMGSAMAENLPAVYNVHEVNEECE